MTTRTWTGTAGDGLWTTNGNWSGGTAPTSADDVVITGSPAIDLNDGFRQCHNLDLSGYTGTLSNGALNPTGTIANIGACNLQGLAELATTGACTLTVAGGAVAFNLWVQAGSTVLASDAVLAFLQLNAGTSLDVGTHTLTTAGLDISGGETTWAWSGSGNVVFSAGADVESSSVQATPSLPPITISNGLTLNGGDLTVDHIIAESGSIVLNGNHIIETNPPVAPAITVSGLQAQTFTALEAAVNAALAGLTDPILHGVDIAAYVDQRRMGIDLRAVVTSVDQGTTLATPFVLKTFTSQLINSDVDAVTALQQQVQAFITANPTYFISAVRLLFVDVGYREPQYIAWLIYNTTSGASANFAFL